MASGQLGSSTGGREYATRREGDKSFGQARQNIVLIGAEDMGSLLIGLASLVTAG